MKNRQTAPLEPPQSPTSFHCDVEWHFRGAPVAALIYPLACRLSYKSGCFSASHATLAEHFQCSPTTIKRAYKYLRETGFLVPTQVRKGNSTRYRVLSHAEWARNHPGLCVQKESFPWDSENDTLGQHLYAVSGQAVRWRPNQINSLREIGLTDDDIVEHFKQFYQLQETLRLNNASVPPQFIVWLRNIV